jgi:hypothetical protein
LKSKKSIKRLLVLLITCLAWQRLVAAEIRPNIVFILCDDLGYGDVHALNSQHCKISTPCMDKIISEGLAFTEAHSSASVCTPSRYSVLTGRYCWRTKKQTSVIFTPDYKDLIAPDRLTLPKVLKTAGYQTAMFGKWHLGADVGMKAKSEIDFTKKIGGGPLGAGFDYYYGFLNSLDMMPYVFIENDHWVGIPTEKMERNKSPHVRPGPKMAGFELEQGLPEMAKRTIEYIRKNAKSDKPFFAYVALPSPHTPHVPAKEWDGKSKLGKYADYVMETDFYIGEIAAALKSEGIDSKTLFIVSSDNGCSPDAGTINLEAAGHFASGDRRGYKTDIWDGGHRIPLLVKWPDVVKPGRKSAQIAGLQDWFATFAEMVGFKVPDNAGEDSFSVLPILQGKEQSSRTSIIYHSIKGCFAIQSGPWKLEFTQGSGGRDKGGVTDTPGQLYEMSQDIGEKTNLYGKNPEVVNQLTKLIEKQISEGRSTPGAKQSNDTQVILWKKEGNSTKDNAGHEGEG